MNYRLEEVTNLNQLLFWDKVVIKSPELPIVDKDGTFTSRRSSNGRVEVIISEKIENNGIQEYVLTALAESLITEGVEGNFVKSVLTKEDLNYCQVFKILIDSPTN